MIAWTGHFIILCWLVFVVFWVLKALDVKKTVESDSKDYTRLLLVLALIGWALTTKLSFLSKPLYVWHTGILFGIITDVLALLGLGICLWARVTLGRNWSANITYKDQHELITSGPYAYVRHPIYTGMLTLALATALNSGLAFGFLLLVILFGGLYFKYKREERLMIEHFNKKYLSYKMRVKALIPYIF